MQALIDPHLQEIESLMISVNSNINGLSIEQRELNQLQSGYNLLSNKKSHGNFYYFMISQLELFSGILWVAIIICVVIYIIGVVNKISGQAYNIYLAVALLSLNILSGSLQAIQHSKSEKTIKSFHELIPSRCLILQNGLEVEVDVQTLTLGDIVVLKSGDKCPADIRVLHSNQLKIDLSAFTGEAEPVDRALVDENPIILNNNAMCFASCPICGGLGLGVVVAIGNSTQIGLYKQRLDEHKPVPTPLQTEIRRLVVFITVASVLIGVIFFGFSMGFGISAIQSFIFSVGIIVANVPEGLSLAITVALQLAAKKLKMLNVLVKSLNDVETLGSVSVICTDKTGTITQNVMTVQSVFDCSSIVHLQGVPNEILKIITLNSNAQFENQGAEGERKIFGDASETAFLRFVSSIDGVDKSKYTLEKEIPFSSEYKFQAMYHTTDSEQYLSVKGAAECVLTYCKQYQINDEVFTINEEFNDKFLTAYQEEANKGNRIIGLAYNKISIEKLAIQDVIDQKYDLIFAGFITLADPPKLGVAEAVQLCKQAHIQITMVTGDHYLTGIAIAKQVGILSQDVDLFINPIEDNNEIVVPVNSPVQNQAKKCFKFDSPQTRLQNRLRTVKNQFIPDNPALGAAMTGAYLRNISDYQLLNFLNTYKQIVFARFTPDQKLGIVKAYQTLAHIVAVSGDGLNDSSALKQADVGVAMASGSEIARDAANIILLDNSFASIVEGVKQGRLIYENLKKSMSYAITTTIPELVPFLLFIVMGFPNALNSIVIVLIDLATSIWPAFALSYEKPEQDLMIKHPRHRKDRMFSKQLCWASYGKIGIFQALCLITTFMIVISKEYTKYTNLALPLNIFVNLKHTPFITSLEAQLTNIISYPNKKVTTPALLAAYIMTVGYSASFVSIVLTQISHAIICRTRINSVFQQGLFTNWRLVITFAVMIIVACIIVYVPFLQPILQTNALQFEYWMYNIPMCVYMVFSDEMRKLTLRRAQKDGIVHRLLYW
ncbi:Sodium/potassium-transporting_ATPase alpha chain [Hexamita inflata]|uniref:Sodium/potassium-transporting ATPase alpha chain n=1 Tax=Hexamita inflata TaxID=28002 RepID=A0AA86TQA6_9EUKA|nr:Sodium/potassium-transporting ATPase alpha chain [Hexamita inflata]